MFCQCRNGTTQTDIAVTFVYRQVALQFADDSLRHSAFVAMTLKDSTHADVFILGDTSYGR